MKLSVKKQTLLLQRYVSKQPYTQEVFRISIRYIKSHCLLSSRRMVRNYTSVIFVNKILVSSR